MIKEIWKNTLPSFGAQIRVEREKFFHHAIYVDDKTVIQFGDGFSYFKNPEVNTVCVTCLKDFLSGGVLEVRKYDDEELKKLKTSELIVKTALQHLGERGYDFLFNNCEHFSNDCAFGIRYSSQTDEIRERVIKLMNKK